MKKELETLDLHNKRHEEGNFLIEKFITDNLEELPVRIVTGHSKVFMGKVNDFSEKYELGCYPENPASHAIWLILKSKI